jgi:hypothetical protein
MKRNLLFQRQDLNSGSVIPSAAKAAVLAGLNVRAKARTLQNKRNPSIFALKDSLKTPHKTQKSFRIGQPSSK